MTENNSDRLHSGPAAAAFVASGIGCTVLGLLTTLAQAIPAVKNALNWWNPAGPLVGKTGLAVILWIAAWVLLHLLWRNKPVGISKAFVATLVLIILGLLGTFPLFYEMFTG
jgi:hypothetical protein